MSQLAKIEGTVVESVQTIQTDLGSASPVVGVINIFGGTNVTTSASGNTVTIDATGSISPLTTKGDLYTYSTMDDRLPVGTDGFLLSANSATATGLEWITAPSSGVTSVTGTANRITSSGGATPQIDIAGTYVGQTSITTLGTIASGTWNGTPIDLATYVSGNLATSHLDSGTGAGVTTFWRGDGSWAVPAGTGVTSVSGTLNRITSSGGTTPVIDIDAAFVGQASITTLGTITTGVWNGTDIAVADGGTGRSTLTNHGVLVGAGAAAITQLATGSAGQVLQSGGAGADPSYSTATYPSTAGSSGKILISDGTNIISSTPTYPNASASTGKFIISDGTNFIASSPTIPNTAGTSGKVLVSDGTNFISSTPTFPNASATSRKIIVSDGTNWVASSETYAVPGTSGNVLTSDGTNWTSAAPSGGSAPNLSLMFKASDFDTLETNFAPLLQDTGTNVRLLVRAFDQTTSEHVNFSFEVPGEVTSGNVTFRVYFYAATATASRFVQFRFSHTAVGNSDSWDVAYTNEDSGDIAVDATQDDVTVASWTETIANLGWAADDLVIARLSRIAPSGTNLASDAYLIAFEIEIPRS